MSAKSAIIGISTLVLLAIANPSKTDYINYAYIKLCDDMGGIEKTACKVLVSTQKENIKEIIEQNTDRKNFILFSLYSTEVLGFKFQTVALIGNYYTFKN